MNKLLKSASGSLKKHSLVYVGILIFVALAGRAALKGHFPMPYDEAYHFGIVQFYQHHLSPFLGSQPASADHLGALTREPSYLYHYLLSFPLRVGSLFLHTVQQQVVFLRLFGVALGVWALVLLYRLARMFGVSRGVAGAAVIAFAITPVFYDVSSQVNYDNLLLPMTLLSVILTVKLVRSIRLGSASYAQFATVLSVILLTSMVKYTFLPIMAGLVAYIFFAWAVKARRRSFTFTRNIKAWTMVAAGGLLLGSSALWLQRYGVDMAMYHTPHPQCHAVLSVQRCLNYAPWARNYQFQQTIAAHPTGNDLHLVDFSLGWLHQMSIGIYSIVHVVQGQAVFVPVVAVRVAMKALVLGALVYGLLRLRRVKNLSVAWGLVAIVSLTYVAALWGQNYSDYRHLGAIVGIQGRYLLPIVALAYVSAALIYTQLHRDVAVLWSGNLVKGYPATGPLVLQEYLRLNPAA